MDQLTLGVDPAFNRTGWGLLASSESGILLKDAGVISPKGSERPEQLKSIYEQFSTR